MKTIVVTGGAGFLGSNVSRRLLMQGNHVIAVDNLSSGSLSILYDLKNNKKFIFIEHDITSPFLLEKIDEIYHLACPASPPRYQADPIQTTKTSVLGSINLLELAKKHNATILFSSTSEIYGDPLEHPQTEEYRGNVNPIGVRACYDEGKRCAESLFFDYHRQYDVSIKIVRIFNTYGPYMDPCDGRVVSNFIVSALHNEPLTIYGDGSQTRSFCYVDDMVDGLIAMMNTPEIRGPINLGNPHEFTVHELANTVLRITGSSSKIIYKKLPEDDPIRRCPDIMRARQLLKWEPKVMLEEGLKKTIAYFEHRVRYKKESHETSTHI